jgi:hypothetical protein
VDPDDVRAYANRPWAVVEAMKRDYWVREFVHRGPDATFEASQALWAHMRALQPGWPPDDERQTDLGHHVELKRAIDRAAGAFLARAGR